MCANMFPLVTKCFSGIFSHESERDNLSEWMINYVACRDLAMSSGVAVADECKQVFEEIKKSKKYRFCIFHIKDEKVGSFCHCHFTPISGHLGGGPGRS